MFKIEITLTWSKLMALLVLALAFIIDWRMNSNTTFSIAIPAVIVMLGFKQGADAYREVKKEMADAN